jgi:hypothetical protein
MHAWALMVQYGYRLLHPMNAPYRIVVFQTDFTPHLIQQLGRMFRHEI